MQKRLISFCLIASVWLMTLCLGMTPAHACCQTPAKRMTADMPPCCVMQATPQPQAQASGSGIGPQLPDLVAATPRFTETWASIQQHQVQRMLSNYYVPDQSNRHMELSVWLN